MRIGASTEVAREPCSPRSKEKDRDFYLLGCKPQFGGLAAWAGAPIIFSKGYCLASIREEQTRE
jgi:hypothetical protein